MDWREVDCRVSLPEQVLSVSIPKEVTYGVIAGVFLLSLLSKRRTPKEPEP
jgi:hypothetical protein